jgi:cell division protein ZapD
MLVGRETVSDVKPNESSGGVQALRFETPLSERSRAWLRLEELFFRARTYIARRDAIDHRAALICIFDIVDTATRIDVKADIIAELDRQQALWASQLQNPEIEREALLEFLSDIDVVARDLHGQIGKVGQHLRDSEWLQAVRQRASTPGGACAFELPMLCSWLGQLEGLRRCQLQAWFEPLAALEEGALLVLKLLRDTGATSNETAIKGSFHRSLSAQRAPLLAVVLVDSGYGLIPEVTANKYAVNLRFLAHEGAFVEASRADPYASDVPFSLRLCSL